MWVWTSPLKDGMDSAAQEVSRVIAVILPLPNITERIVIPVAMFTHSEWPNG